MPEAKSFPLPSSMAVTPRHRSRAGRLSLLHASSCPRMTSKFWFYNSMHFPEPMHHFDMITAEAAYCALGAFNTRVHVLPTTKGIDHRVINGRVYIGGVPVTDPGGNRRAGGRIPAARRSIITNTGNELYDQWKVKMKALIADAQALPDPVAARAMNRSRPPIPARASPPTTIC